MRARAGPLPQACGFTPKGSRRRRCSSSLRSGSRGGLASFTLSVYPEGDERRDDELDQPHALVEGQIPVEQLPAQLPQLETGEAA